MKLHAACKVIKLYKRLHIVVVDTGAIVYTPPDFVKLPSRAPLQALALAFSDSQHRDIDLIANFEHIWGRRVT